ncbi:hypothetical protein [Streptomyces sp. or20]|uniref:hypothetical protein n=1 Tax=Streptomyces sp. or20 TaxID=1828016 RepID=UPI000BF149FE|nr:hypothetical protein [Streptomyces sp. or20]
MTKPAAVFELQTYDYSANAWQTVDTYDTAADSRAEGNAYFDYRVHLAAGPTRLLKGGVTDLGYDNPDDYYDR